MSLSNSKDYAITPGASQLPAPAGAEPTYFLPKVEPGRLFGIVLRRGWIVLLLAVLGAAALYAFASRLPKIYRATGSVYVSSQAPLVLDIRAVAPEETRDLEQMRSVEQGLGASTLLMRVIEVNRLAEDPAFAPQGASPQVSVGNLCPPGENRTAPRHPDHRPAGRGHRSGAGEATWSSRWSPSMKSGPASARQAITLQASEGLAREEDAAAGAHGCVGPQASGISRNPSGARVWKDRKAAARSVTRWER